MVDKNVSCIVCQKPLEEVNAVATRETQAPKTENATGFEVKFGE